MNPVAPVTATLIVRQPQLGFGERRLNTMRHGTPTRSRQTPTPKRRRDLGAICPDCPDRSRPVAESDRLRRGRESRRQLVAKEQGVGDGVSVPVVVEVGVHVAALRRAAAPGGRPTRTRRASPYEPWYGCSSASGPVEAHVRPVGGELERMSAPAGRGCTARRRAGGARRTRRRAATSARAARPPTGSSTAPSTGTRRAVRRCASSAAGAARGSGPRCSPSRATRSRWLAIHDAGSRSFMRCDPKAPSLTA